MNWRPDDWVQKNIYWAGNGTFEAGASALLSALLKWLHEPCDKHKSGKKIEWVAVEGEPYCGFEIVATYPDHRYLCPQCMAELKESEL